MFFYDENDNDQGNGNKEHIFRKNVQKFPNLYMIFLISEENDRSTHEIIEWLLVYRNIFFVNYIENFTPISLTLKHNRNENIDVYYHRRARLNLIPKDLDDFIPYRYLKNEQDPIVKVFELIKKECTYYIGGFYEEEQHNKIYDLHLAQKCDLKIPDTLVTNQKQDLISFMKDKQVLSKAIKYPFYHNPNSKFSTQNFLASNI